MDDAQTIFDIVTRGHEQTVRIGSLFASVLHPGDLIAMSGQLGAGKTQFVRGLAVGIDADERLVSSPTFVMMQEYAGRIPLIHIDAYRIESLDELESIGWSDELLHDSVVAIEWSERIESELPSDRWRVELSHVDEAERRIRISAEGKNCGRLPTAIKLLTESFEESTVMQINE